MNKTSITIDRKLFETLTPKTYNSSMFNSGDNIRIISVNSDKLLSWGKAEVPALEIEVNGRTMEVPINIILGTVISKPDIIHNEDSGELECIDFVGNTLYDYIKSNGHELEDIIHFPDQITILKRINKGIPKGQIHKKKALYEESFLVDEGNSFDMQFENKEFVPTIFKSALGNIRTNGTYLIDPIE